MHEDEHGEAASRIAAHCCEDGERVFLSSLILMPYQYTPPTARISSEDRRGSHLPSQVPFERQGKSKSNRLNRNRSCTIANRILFNSHNVETGQQNIRRRAVRGHIQPRFMPARGAASQKIANIGVIMLV